MRPSGLVLAVIVSTALAAACGGAQPVSEAPTPEPPPPVPSAEASDATERPTVDASVDPLWAFQAEQVSGGTFDGAVLSGRDVAVWFWAPW